MKFDYNKEYTIQELFDFEDETIFVCVYNKYKVKIICNRMYYKIDEFLEWRQIENNKNWIVSKYKLFRLEEEVIFNDIIMSNKDCKIRVEHERLDYYYKFDESDSDDPTIRNSYILIKNKNYLDIDLLILSLSWELDSKELKEVIKNGKWYMKRPIG